MTVVHVFSGDLWAGAEVMIAHLLTDLQRRPGLRVIALSLNEGTLTERLRRAGLQTHVVPEAGRPFARLVVEAARLLRSERGAILHAHRYKENLLAWLVGRWLGARAVVTTLHGLDDPGVHEPHASASRRARIRLNRLLVRRGFTCAVAVSDEMRATLVERLGFAADRVEVIRNGVPVPAERRADRFGRPPRVGSVGRLVPVKGFELAVAIAAALRHDPGNVRMSILGEGPLRPALLGRARALGLDETFELCAPRDDPGPFYRALDVYLSTSRHEGMPLSVLEAMAWATPVVAPRVGGIPEAVTDGAEGFLIDGRDPEAFAARCRLLLADPALRRSMGARARERVRVAFSVEAMGEAYLKLYERCGGGR
ncbi:MAG TPA: glycosyltransferase [Methylomirabilota bacterium]|jgi:glycosyltransferase involved in cell wall biosynthesis|nr:glycosyltransferase [Methylomirabilota bacterium]